MNDSTSQIMSQGSLIIAMSAMNRSAFDFIGKYLGFENGCLILENPLVLDYDDGRVLKRLAPLHLPYGMVEINRQRNVLSLPLDSMAYYVALPEDGLDWMHAEYEKFFAGEV